jgi:chromosome segregation ATPase
VSKTVVRLLVLLISSLARYEAGSKLAGVIYINRISDNRFSGIAGRNFRIFRELCGDDTLQNVVLVTNMWAQVTQDVGEAREKELATNFFKPVLVKGARLTRHYDTAQSAHDIIRSIMKNIPIPLQIQRELVDEGKDITNTAAGEAINQELNKQIRQHKKELNAVKQEMKELKEKDEEARREMEEDARKLREEMNKMRLESKTLAASYREEKKKTEEMMMEMQEHALKEREEADAAHKQQIDILKKRLEDEADNSSAEREKLQQRVKELEDQWNNRSKGGGCLIM